MILSIEAIQSPEPFNNPYVGLYKSAEPLNNFSNQRNRSKTLQISGSVQQLFKSAESFNNSSNQGTAQQLFKSTNRSTTLQIKEPFNNSTNRLYNVLTQISSTYIQSVDSCNPDHTALCISSRRHLPCFRNAENAAAFPVQLNH